MNSTNPAACEQNRRLLLDVALRAEVRAELFAAMLHVQSCEGCRVALQDFDRINQILAPVQEALPADLDSFKWVDRAMRALPSAHRSGLRIVPLMRLGMAASIAMILGIGGYWLGRRAEPINPAPGSTEIAASITPMDVSNRARAFEQVSKAFDHRAGWMLVSDSASDVGLEAEPSDDRGMLLVRLTLSRRNNIGDSTRSNQIVSSADLAILPGRSAKLSLPFSQGRMLSYEISVGTGDPTRLGLIAELLPSGGGNSPDSAKPLTALSTTLDLRPGGASPAGSFVTGNADYELTVGFSKADLATEKSP